MTYDNSDATENSGQPAPPPWLQFAPEPADDPSRTDGRHENRAFPGPPPPPAPPTGVPYAPQQPHPQHQPQHQAPPPVHQQPGPHQPLPQPPVGQSGPPQPGPPQPGPPQPGPPQPGPPPTSPNDAIPPQSFPPQSTPPQSPPPQSFPPPGRPMPPNGFPTDAPAPGFGQPQTGPALDEVALIRKARRAPSRGWRRAVHTISAGTINPGESSADVEYKQLLERVNRPVRGDYRIAVLSLKGGVGKTTTTVGLGSTFSSLRGDRVIAVDANPDLGTLAQRIPQQTRSTVRDLLADTNVYRYSDVRAHTSQAPSRLEVLASERDPAVAEAFSEDEYRGVVQILQRFYNIIITDCGTGLSHSAMNGVLDLANSIILVSSPALDGARSAGSTLDWLEAHGYGHLVSGAVVVLSSSRPGASTIDTNQLAAHFLTRCRAVHQIPFDDHLSEGADIDLDLIGKPTRRAFVELAATVADDFASGGNEYQPTSADQGFAGPFHP